MAYSYTLFTGNGSTTQYAVAFGYIRREHVLATVAGSPATFTWVNNSLIQMDTAPANGAAVRVYRVTPLSAPLVDFADGATLVAADLDTNARQSVYTQQELDDELVDGLAGVIPNGDKGDITTSVGGSVWTIDAGAVTETKIGTGAVTEAKIGTGAVTSAKILDGTILNADVNASAGITAGKLSFTQAGTGATARTVDSKLKDTVSVKDFGALGDGVANDFAAIQAAVTAVCGANKTLFFPVGTYLVSAPIVFPNNSFIVRGDSPTGTIIKAFNPAASTDLFQINGTGPAKVIENIGFNGPSAGAYGLGAGINVNGNGVLLNNVWFQGLLYGLKATGSFINCNFCVAEYCYIATEVTAALDETIWYGWTMYKNETDFSIAGTQKSFIIRDTTAIGTKTDVLACFASGLVFDGLLVQNDGTAYTPTILNILGGYNLISSIKVYNFGAIGVFFQGGSAVKNRVSNLIIEGVPTAIFASVGSDNTVSNFTLKGATTYGIRLDAAARNEFNNFRIENCNYGIYLIASESSSFSNGSIATSTTADWYYPTNNITETFINNVSADFSALSTMTFLSTNLSSGNKQTMVTAVPATATWTRGDVAINRLPAVGSPKAWRCTVAGTPGTWVSEGNL